MRWGEAKLEVGIQQFATLSLLWTVLHDLHFGSTELIARVIQELFPYLKAPRDSRDSLQALPVADAMPLGLRNLLTRLKEASPCWYWSSVCQSGA